MNAAKRNTANAGKETQSDFIGDDAGNENNATAGAAVLEPPTDGKSGAAVEGNPGTAVATSSESTALATPATGGIDFAADAGDGMEDYEKKDLQPAIIRIIQSGSPERKPSDPKQIKGAEEGDLLHTVDKVIFKREQGIHVIVCHYERSYIEWVTKENGGGFRGEHDASIMKQTFKDEKNRDILPNGNQIAENATYYCLLVDLNDITKSRPVVISMSSTQWKNARNLNEKISTQTVETGNPKNPIAQMPMYGNIWHVTTKPESNEKGSWMGWDFSLHGKVQDVVLYNAAKSFRNSVKDLEVKVDYTQMDDDSFDPDSFNEYEAKSVNPDDVI